MARENSRDSDKLTKRTLRSTPRQMGKPVAVIVTRQARQPSRAALCRTSR
jgi:hypothetical protein